MNWATFLEDLQGCTRQFGEIASDVGGALLLAQLGHYVKAIDKLGEAVSGCKDAIGQIEKLIDNLQEMTRA